jgi:hypothetical protein
MLKEGDLLASETINFHVRRNNNLLINMESLIAAESFHILAMA